MKNRDALIAVAWGSPGGATAEISLALEELLSKRPRPNRLWDLGGPNETIQILLNPEDWALIAKAVAAIYGAELVKEAAKSTWKASANSFSKASEALKGQFANLVSAVRQALFAKAPVIFGFPRTPIGGRRHIGIEVIDAEPEEIGRIIAVLAKHGEEIEEKLNEWERIHENQKGISYPENSDCSVKITLKDDGSIRLSGWISESSTTSHEVVIFDIKSPPAK